jgi:hypothetical protein
MENQDSSTATAWRSLYRMGGIAPLIALVLYLSEMAIVVAGGTFPTSEEGWYSLFAQSKLLGLHYINALDIVSVTLLGVMFLALYKALRKDNESTMAIAAFLAFLGVAVFIAMRWQMTSAIISLSDQYAAASSEAQRSQIIAAGIAVSATGRPTPQTPGFLLTAAAVFMMSLVTLRGRVFGKATACAGIAASVVTLAYNVCQIAAPPLTIPLLGLTTVFWVAWWIMTAIGLLRLGNPKRGPT